jgi:hypothetical protein
VQVSKKWSSGSRRATSCPGGLDGVGRTVGSRYARPILGSRRGVYEAWHAYDWLEELRAGEGGSPPAPGGATTTSRLLTQGARSIPRPVPRNTGDRGRPWVEPPQPLTAMSVQRSRNTAVKCSYGYALVSDSVPTGWAIGSVVDP